MSKSGSSGKACRTVVLNHCSGVLGVYNRFNKVCAPLSSNYKSELSGNIAKHCSSIPSYLELLLSKDLNPTVRILTLHGELEAHRKIKIKQLLCCKSKSSIEALKIYFSALQPLKRLGNTAIVTWEKRKSTRNLGDCPFLFCCSKRSLSLSLSLSFSLFIQHTVCQIYLALARTTLA